MAPSIGKHDVFEGEYRERFRTLVKPLGEFINYERDRCGLDIGLHLTNPAADGNREVTDRRIWFQLKGVHEETLPLAVLQNLERAPIDLRIDHLKFWYHSCEAVFVVLYVASASLFLVDSAQGLLNRRWPESLDPLSFKEGQETVRLYVDTSAVLTTEYLLKLVRNTASATAGPSFRGSLLGHSLDPLRSSLAPLEPSAFLELVDAILAESEFVFDNADQSLPGVFGTLKTGTMRKPFFWVFQLTTQFSSGPPGSYRKEGKTEQFQGRCAAIVIPTGVHPSQKACEAIAKRLETEQVEQVFAFINAHLNHQQFGFMWGTGRESGVRWNPLDLTDLAFNVLSCNRVYRTFRERISWDWVTFLPPDG